MRMHKFDIIEVHKAGNNINVIKRPGVPVNLDHIFFVMPTLVPSNVAGPNGQPVGKQASQLVSSGGVGITVDMEVDEFLRLIDNPNKYQNEKPVSISGDLVEKGDGYEVDFEPEPTIIRLNPNQEEPKIEG